ncbi:transposable element p transposase [Plakobranchus ocellatus]|uniref:Transposable element p transposase n=1 Tax=Plakobranchus ocellatus TaxID=259542 RepID=A0AAV4AQJ7_9GAST|nr:transposable element p transposase [Plakobranchus ocellatus]
MVALKFLPDSALPTAYFIKRCDSLFNCFNSYTKKSTKPYNHALTKHSTHHAFLKDCKAWLDNLQSNSKIRTPPCLDGWRVSICSLEALSTDLFDNYGINYLLNSRLNQDCLEFENLFSIIRGKGGQRDNPNVVDFKGSFLQTVIDQLFVTSDRKNCEDDVDHFLINLATMRKHTDTSSHDSRDDPNACEIISPTELPQDIGLQTENVVTYIGGFIVKKLKNKLCPDCVNALTGNIHTESPSHALLQSKQYSKDCTVGLHAPSDLLVSICMTIEKHYLLLCGHILHNTNIRQHLCSRLLSKITMRNYKHQTDRGQFSRQQMQDAVTAVLAGGSLRKTAARFDVNLKTL